MSPPQHGLYTAIVGGAVIALLGGSKVQVSGPTAAFVVILAPIAARFGLGGLLVASLLAGCMLLLMGMARMGRLIEFIPYPVTTGFTAGIAVVIATIQLRDLLGLTVELPAHYLEKVAALLRAAPGFQLDDLAIGLLTLVPLIVAPKVTRRIPAPIVALPLIAGLAYALSHTVAGFDVATIHSRFGQSGGIPQQPPIFAWPWLAPAAGGEPIQDSIDVPLLRSLLVSAFAIAMLGAIESLLSAVVADGMTGTKHDPDVELIAQGVGNIAAPFFGGFAVTGAIARTATNIRYGARSPIAALAASLFVLVVMLACAPLLGYLPMASMAALLLVVAWNMADIRHVAYILRVAPRSDILVLLACFGLTVIFDMVVAVSVGVVLASLLFMQRMAEVANVKLLGDRHPALDAPLPEGVVLYQIAGALFFGAAEKAMSALRHIHSGVRVVILDLTAVPHMDATGLTALESVLARLHAAKVFIVIAGVQDQPLRLMARAGWKHRDWLVVWQSFEDAVTLAKTLARSDFIVPEHPHAAVEQAARAR